MNYVKVKSSQIEEVGYGSGLYGPETLSIRFKSKSGITQSPYHYKNVTPQEYQALMAAESIGSYFGKNIKPFPEQYPFTKVGVDPTQPVQSNGNGSHEQTSNGSSHQTPVDGTSDTPSPGFALALIDGMADDLLFTPGRITDEQLAIMRSDWLSEAKKYDISTEAKRTELKRFARPLQKLRTGIEARAKELTGATKRKIAAIDAEKRRLVDIVGGIESEVLGPLTAWEQEEDSRKTRLSGIANELAAKGQRIYANVAELEMAIAQLESFDLSTMREFKVGAESAVAASLKVLKPELERRKKSDADRVELENLRAAAAARAEQDRLEGIAKQAVEAERQRAESERVLMEQRTQAAERRAEEVAAQAKRDQEQAVENERMRAVVEVKREREAAEARAANKAHRLKIDNEALVAIVALDIPMDRAQDLLIAITKGLVPHVSIQY